MGNGNAKPSPPPPSSSSSNNNVNTPKRNEAPKQQNSSSDNNNSLQEQNANSQPSLRPFDVKMNEFREKVLQGEKDLQLLSKQIEEFKAQPQKDPKDGESLYREVLKYEELFTQIQLGIDGLEVPTIGGRKGPGSFQCPNARADRKTAVQYVENVLQGVQTFKLELDAFKPL